MHKILIVDDEPSILEFLQILLRREGYEVETCASPERAFKKIKVEDYSLVITDLSMPKFSGIDILSSVKKTSPKTSVVIVTAFATAESAVEAMKLGAFDYIMKPFNVEDIKITVRNAVKQAKLQNEIVSLKKKQSESSGLERFIGQSPEMEKVSELIRRISSSRANVLVVGESGTGKELAAKSIHEMSARREGPFISVNCGAIPENLVESEFFGYRKGAFTGADEDRDGLFVAADGGTLFLDEVGDLPLNIQVKLLRVLQEKRVMPLGSTETQKVDVRIISATNVNLEEAVKTGEFREDLFYRLNVIEIKMPPLRERRDDIPPLIRHFLGILCDETSRAPVRISNQALHALQTYDYPGNIRELENILEQTVTLIAHDEVGADDLPMKVRHSKSSDSEREEIFPDQGLDLDKTMDAYERKILENALQKTGGIRKKAADLLNISFRSMRYRLTKHQIEVSRGGEDD